MRLYELFDEKLLCELRQYIEAKRYGGWITPDNKVEYVSGATQHRQFLIDRGISPDLNYQVAFEMGYVRFVTGWKARPGQLILEGQLDDIKRTFRIWWPTAKESMAVRIESPDLTYFSIFEIPEHLSGLMKKFGPQQTKVNEN